MRISDFDYELPEELIAQEPLTDRASSRMLIIDRAAGTIVDSDFAAISESFRQGDTLVLNNTKVFPARLFGTSETGAQIEIFLVAKHGDKTWEALARPARRLPVGKKITFGQILAGEVVEKLEEGRVLITFEASEDLDTVFDKIGTTPLPPYIKRTDPTTNKDRERYQTVFAKNRGAIAAPTAGLHFTPETLEKIRERGAAVCEITLHVGYGTFEPVRVDDLSVHRVLPERYEITKDAAERLNSARAGGRRIIVVGTTTTRMLESAAAKHKEFIAEESVADLTITPGYKFKVVDGLLTNFHLPRSSLLVLVSTFAGHQLITQAYQHAVRHRYRFYSYGDCMLIL